MSGTDSGLNAAFTQTLATATPAPPADLAAGAQADTQETNAVDPPPAADTSATVVPAIAPSAGARALADIEADIKAARGKIHSTADAIVAATGDHKAALAELGDLMQEMHAGVASLEGDVRLELDQAGGWLERIASDIRAAL